MEFHLFFFVVSKTFPARLSVFFFGKKNCWKIHWLTATWCPGDGANSRRHFGTDFILCPVIGRSRETNRNVAGGFYWVLPSFTGLTLCFTGFYRVLLGFTHVDEIVDFFSFFLKFFLLFYFCSLGREIIPPDFSFFLGYSYFTDVSFEW